MSDIVEKVSLIQVNIENNNNKVWYGTLYDNGDVLLQWGRVGKKINEKLKEGAGESFLRSKERAKRKGKKGEIGYTDLNIVEGSEHEKQSSGGGSKAVNNGALKAIAKKQIKHSNPIVAKLIDYLTQQNVHNITSFSGGKITYSDATGLFSTPLGIITQENIDEARIVLSEIADLVTEGKYGKRMTDLSSRLLVLSPRDIGMRKFDIDSEWSDISKVQVQNTVLDGLQASLASVTSTTTKKTAKAKKDDPNVFNTQLELIEDNATFKKVYDNYVKMRSSMHGCSHYKPKQVWSVNIASMHDAYAKRVKAVGGEIQGYHGTGSENLLSLIKTGFLVRPPSNAAISGKMYGQGTYFAPAHVKGSASKSTNYSLGYWAGKSSSRTFVLICDVAMGKHYVPRGSIQRIPAGYDSCWAKKNQSGVLNDECIVYKDNQANIRYLVELTDR